MLLRSQEGFSTEGLDAPRNEWLEERGDVKSSVKGWEMIVKKGVSVRDIPGNHFEPFEEANVCLSHDFAASLIGRYYRC